MQVAISTTDREPAFVHDLLKTLLAGGQADGLRIRCVVCGPEGGYLDRWGDHVVTEVLDKRGLRKLNHLKPKRRIFFNAIRCLLGADFDDSLLFCQDDVVFCAEWRDKLAKMVATAPEYLGKSQPRHRQLGRDASCPPDDIWLKEWCTRQDLPILCGIPNLVQHIGKGSTIGSPFHESPTYEG
jgi:hypothetical protein